MSSAAQGSGSSFLRVLTLGTLVSCSCDAFKTAQALVPSLHGYPLPSLGRGAVVSGKIVKKLAGTDYYAVTGLQYVGCSGTPDFRLALVHPGCFEHEHDMDIGADIIFTSRAIKCGDGATRRYVENALVTQYDVVRWSAEMTKNGTPPKIDVPARVLPASTAIVPGPSNQKRGSEYGLPRVPVGFGPQSLLGKWSMVQDSAAATLVDTVAKIMKEEPKDAVLRGGKFNMSHLERMTALVEAVTSYYQAQQSDRVNPSDLYSKLVRVGAPPMVLRLIGKSKDTDREIREIKMELEARKTVVVVHKSHYVVDKIRVIQDAAATAQKSWLDGQMGPAAFDAEVPLPLELIKAVCATYKDGDPDILFIVMATDRLEFLQEARPREGESVSCPICGIELAQDEVRNHFNRGNCHTSVVKLLAGNGHKLLGCRADSACTDPDCIHKEPTDPTQEWEPFLSYASRSNHENRHLRRHLYDNPRKISCTLRSKGFVETVRVSVDYVGAPSQQRLPIYDAIGTIIDVKPKGSFSVRFDSPVHGAWEHEFRFGFTLTRLSDGEKFHRKARTFVSDNLSKWKTEPRPVPKGPVRARTAGGRVATILYRYGTYGRLFAVELDGDADGEGDAFERKSLWRKEFEPGQDELLNSAPVADAETVASDKKKRTQKFDKARYRAKRAKVAASD